MKKLMNKNFIQKTVIAILIVLSFNFVVPTFSSADPGGILWTPIRWLVTGIGDSIIYWLNFYFVGLTMDQVEDLTSGELQTTSTLMTKRYKDMDTSEKATITPTDEEKNSRPIVSVNMGEDAEIPLITYGPDLIFSNQVPGLDANYINPKDFSTFSIENPSITKTLQGTIAQWYKSLRNFVAVCLLSVLLYVAIRMIISSTASDKAKYKQMLLDWLVSICLLFFMHYIMSFTMALVDIISSNLGASNLIIIGLNTGSQFKVNIMGYCRFMTQSSEFMETAGFTILYIALLIYTCKFTWEYMKRSIKMAFLTLMAPLVTLTYAIDKMGDGKAQAFNMWLKEYIFTALIQPFHLIIYTIFMSAGMNIAVANPLYAILFLAFLTPAEKLLRKFFRFDEKGGSGGSSFAGGFGGAAAFNAVKGAINKGASAISQGKNGNGNNSNIRQKKQITDPNAPNGNLDSFKNGKGNEQLGEGRTQNSRTSGAKSNNKDEVLDKYSSEGFGKNANGEYFNPYTDEYDPDYDPHKDPSYNIPQKDEVLDKYSSEGFGKNANGEYFNPYTDEYDPDYDPHKDPSYNLPQNDSSNKETELYKRNIQPGNKKIMDLADNTRKRFENTKSVRSGNARTLKKPVRGALRVAGHALKTTGIVAGKLAGAATLGAIGLGMGIAGDDLEDVFKYAAAGAALGYTALPALGKNAVNEVRNLGNTIRSDYEIGAYGETQALLNQQTRDTLNDKELRASEKERMTRENNGVAPTRSELNERMNQVAEYKNAGITDTSAMHKAMKVEKEINQQLEQSTNISDDNRNKIARQQAIEIAKIADQYSQKDLRDEKKLNELHKELVRKLTSGDTGISEKEASGSANRIITNVKKVKGVG